MTADAIEQRRARRIFWLVLQAKRRGENRQTILRRIVSAGFDAQEAKGILEASLERMREQIERERFSFRDDFPRAILSGTAVLLLLVYIVVRVRDLYAFQSFFSPVLVALGTNWGVLAAVPGKRGAEVQRVCFSLVLAGLCLIYVWPAEFLNSLPFLAGNSDVHMPFRMPQALGALAGLGLSWVLPKGLGLDESQLMQE